MLVHFDVNGTPPDIILARFFEDDTLVLGTATRLLTGKVDERTRGGNDGALVSDSILVQLCDGRITLEVDPGHVEAGVREVLEVLAQDY